MLGERLPALEAVDEEHPAPPREVGDHAPDPRQRRRTQRVEDARVDRARRARHRARVDAVGEDAGVRAHRPVDPEERGLACPERPVHVEHVGAPRGRREQLTKERALSPASGRAQPLRRLLRLPHLNEPRGVGEVALLAEDSARGLVFERTMEYPRRVVGYDARAGGLVRQDALDRGAQLPIVLSARRQAGQWVPEQRVVGDPEALAQTGRCRDDPAPVADDGEQREPLERRR